MYTNTVACLCQRSDVEGFNMFKSFFNPFTVGFGNSFPCATAPVSAVFPCCVGISKGMLQSGRERIFPISQEGIGLENVPSKSPTLS